MNKDRRTRITNILNQINNLAEDLRVAHKTAERWLAALERLYGLFRLAPFGAPCLKAIKKALMDAGLGDYPLVLHGASSVPQDLVAEVRRQLLAPDCRLLTLVGPGGSGWSCMSRRWPSGLRLRRAMPTWRLPGRPKGAGMSG